ncbi:DUF4194 domain-containing protein [Saccharothrix sp. Mg75]|uniref:DUF4194 domain-containing protein n=1 Tax=Saccharothrix sp. Mg75 TaxID=3445357 RepID=UPI003EEBAF08
MTIDDGTDDPTGTMTRFTSDTPVPPDMGGDDAARAEDDARLGEQFPDLEDDGEDREPTSTLSLFEGDEGGLLLAQRQVLVHLVKEPFISAQTHPRDWRMLVGNPRPIRSRLNDMFMVLELDLQREVAFTRQASPEGGGRRFPTLFHDQAWTREETIVLVCLRLRCHTEQAAGNGRVFIDREDVHDYVARFRPPHATDEAADRGRVERALERIYRTGLLIGRKAGQRFEIARAVEVVMPLARLTELLAWLRQQNGTGQPVPDASGQPVHTAGQGDDGTVVEGLR